KTNWELSRKRHLPPNLTTRVLFPRPAWLKRRQTPIRSPLASTLSSGSASGHTYTCYLIQSFINKVPIKEVSN
ncbi:mCG1045702, isoform CRA_a, partial [Mus musculus]